MKVTPKQTLTEDRLNDLSSAFADCVKESFKDTLPKAKITVYMRTPKYDDKGNMSSAFKYDISDDTVDEETRKELMALQYEPLRQCFLDKISPNTDRDPDRNWVGYFGHVLSLDEVPDSESDEKLTELFSLDESQWIEIIEFAQKKNWYSKFEIIGGVVRQAIIQISVRELWGLLKAHLSEDTESGDDHSTDLIEKIKDLPIEEILEEIRKHLGDFIL